MLRPVALDADGSLVQLWLLRETWGPRVPTGWMWWCYDCRTVLPGTALSGSAGCDLEDLVSRWPECLSWEAECARRHRDDLLQPSPPPPR